jgi:hypothetical protein
MKSNEKNTDIKKVKIIVLRFPIQVWFVQRIFPLFCTISTWKQKANKEKITAKKVLVPNGFFSFLWINFLIRCIKVAIKKWWMSFIVLWICVIPNDDYDWEMGFWKYFRSFSIIVFFKCNTNPLKSGNMKLLVNLCNWKILKFDYKSHLGQIFRTLTYQSKKLTEISARKFSLGLHANHPRFLWLQKGELPNN